MPFPIEIKYIEEMENILKVKFPQKYKIRMQKNNGGKLVNKKFDIQLHPFYDKKDRKRISRTCNHIERESKNARDCLGFPKNAIAIGKDDYGNILVLIHNGNGILSEELYFWDHETRSINKIGTSILELEK